MRQDIVPTDVIDEIGALQHFGGLMARAAEQRGPAGFPGQIGSDQA